MLESKSRTRGRHGLDRLEASKSLSRVFCLRIVLLEIVPPVWRRLRLPETLTLRQLDVILRCVMGWSGDEAHRFRVGSALYGKTSDGILLRDSRWVSLADVHAGGSGSFRYELVSDGTWEHEIVIESLSDGTVQNQRLECLAGEGAWPPETCGSPDAYVDRADLLAAGSSGGPLDLGAINQALARLR